MVTSVLVQLSPSEEKTNMMFRRTQSPLVSLAWLVSIVAIATLSNSTAFSQTTNTGNWFVTAKVNGSTGKVNVYTTDGGFYGGEKILTFPDMSALTLNINDQYWTNSDQVDGFDRSKPDYGGTLNNGNTTKVADTVRTIWKIASGEIIQDVYPVAFDFSGQIVMKWKYHCVTYDLKSVRMQYLLDTWIDGNDKARVLTRYGYRNTWTLYTHGNPNYDDIPTFYQAFKYDLDAAHNYNPGVVSQGTLIDPELGLMKPDAVVVGDWTVLSLILWGWPQSLATLGKYDDSAILMQFVQSFAEAGNTVEIGRTSYGTGEFETCTGDLYGLIFRPRKIKPDATGTGYKPNPFNVDLYLFNTNEFTEASSTQATLNVGKHLTILDSGAINNRTQQTQWATPKTTPVGGVSVVSWHVFADKTCELDTSFLQISAKCNLADPSFNAPCKLPVTLPCLDRDTLPPLSYPIVSNGFVKQIAFDDNRPRDRGITDRVDLFGYDPTKFSVTVSPFTACTHEKVWVTVTQLDSTIGGCVGIRVTDCAGNSTVEQVCFPKYPLHPDTIPARFQVLKLDTTFDGSLCNMKYDSVLVIDDTIYDLGLKSIDITPSTTPVNMALDIQPFPRGAARQGFSIHVLDSMVDGSISVRATDQAGNVSDYTTTYCTIPDRNPPTLSVVQSAPFEWSVLAEDQKAYDRHIDSISVHDRVNVQLVRNSAVFEPTRDLTRGAKSFAFKIEVIDTTSPASFCVKVKDLADSVSTNYNAANWWSRDTCLDRQPGKDVWAPNIALSPSPFLSPTSVTVTIDDIHYYSPSLVVGWDKGIDKVWFDNIDGYIVPDTIFGHCEKQLPPFEIHVADSTAIKTISSVCMHAIDCAGNQTDTCLYYPVKPDELAPYILGTNAQRSQIDLMVSDSALYDRGLRHLELVDRVNFDPFEKIVNGSKLEYVPATTTNPSQSATAKLVVTDLWGIATGTAADSAQHTASADVAVWVQDLRMRMHGISQQDADAEVPVLFMPTDTFKIGQKGITNFSFTFDLSGDPNFTYAGVLTTGYATDGWNVTGNEVARRVTITGVSPTGTPLLRDDTLLKILIHSSADESTRQVTLVPVAINGSTLTYNNAATTTIKESDHATVLLPPPFGSITGTTIVAQGSCSPSVGSSAKPSIAMLGRITPNPVQNTAEIEYGLPQTAFASLIIYDGVGREVTRLVSSEQTEGYHKVSFNAAAVPSGTYYARLQVNDGVVTKRIEVGK
jgi:hypothetical protein